MVEQPKPEYDEEREGRAYRFVVTCCANNKIKTWLINNTGIKKPTMTTYEQGRIIPRKVLPKIAHALGMQPMWLSRWLIDGDENALNAYEKEKIDLFEALPEDEQLRRKNELGWGRGPRRP